jgi:hypothetical protein
MKTVSIVFTRTIKYHCLVTLSKSDKQLLRQSCLIARDNNNQAEEDFYNKLMEDAIPIEITPFIFVDTLSDNMQTPNLSEEKFTVDTPL